MLSVGHFVDRYPCGPHDFIYAQVCTGGERRDRILAARGTSSDAGPLGPAAWSALDQVPVWPVGTLLPGELRDRVVDRLWPSRYLARLGAFMEREVGRWQIDVVHAHFGMAAAKVAEACRRSGVPLVTTFYGVDASACLRSRRWLARYRPLFEVGSLFVVLSEAVALRLQAAGCPPEKVVVRNLGLDLSDIPVVPREPGPRPRLLCIARFVPKKGHGLLLDAFVRLRRDHDARLTLIGYGPLLSGIRRSVRDHGLEHVVTLVDTGADGDFRSLLRRALEAHDVFVLPSVVADDGDDEGGPALTALYAQASGMPVVVTRFAGSERSVVDGETGLYAAADPGSLAARIGELVREPGLAQKLGINGSELVRRKFALDVQREVMAGDYRRVMAGGRSPAAAAP